jgi:hypothetical protein
MNGRLVFLIGFETEGFVKYGSDSKNRLLGFIVQMVTVGINYDFWDAEQLESDYGQIRANFRQRRKLFMLYVTPKSFSHQLQLLVMLKVKEVHLFHMFLTTTTND